MSGRRGFLGLMSAFAFGPKASVCSPVAEEKVRCAESGEWLLVYRYVVNIQEDFEGAPVYQTCEMFDGRRYPSEEAAYAGAAGLRQTGVVLPGLQRFGRDSNIMPESITPMPHLLALQLGLKGVERGA